MQHCTVSCTDRYGSPHSVWHRACRRFLHKKCIDHLSPSVEQLLWLPVKQMVWQLFKPSPWWQLPLYLWPSLSVSDPPCSLRSNSCPSSSHLWCKVCSSSVVISPLVEGVFIVRRHLTFSVRCVQCQDGRCGVRVHVCSPGQLAVCQQQLLSAKLVAKVWWLCCVLSLVLLCYLWACVGIYSMLHLIYSLL